MDSRPDVSVIVANYNGAAYLTAALRSVLAQSVAALEVLVVDDASSDASVRDIRTLAAEDRRVRLFTQLRNAGPGAARNLALAQARGEWLAVFDSDDLMAPDRLERLIARARQDGAKIVADDLMVFSEADAQGKPFLGASAPRWVDLAGFIATSRMYARTPNLGYLKPLISAELVARSGARYREDLRIGEDYDFLLQLLATGERLRLEPAPFYRYRKHGASISHVLTREHILTMLASDDAFVAAHELAPPARRAMARRRRSLTAALAYQQVVEDLKRGAVGQGLLHAVRRPAAWPLLTMPIAARLRRAAARLRAPAAPSAAEPALR
jgi:succinoglycan biosynthesis protein ExoO